LSSNASITKKKKKKLVRPYLTNKLGNDPRYEGGSCRRIEVWAKVLRPYLKSKGKKTWLKW
jgi:hypothetical protein